MKDEQETKDGSMIAFKSIQVVNIKNSGNMIYSREDQKHCKISRLGSHE